MITEVHPSSANLAEARKFGLCWHNERAERWPCGRIPAHAPAPAPSTDGPSILCPLGHRHVLPVLDAECWLDAEQVRDVEVTVREYDVASEILKTGASNREIGGKLYLTEDTIKSHVKKLLMRTGTKTRSELAVAVFRGRVRLVPVKTVTSVRRANRPSVMEDLEVV